MKMSMGLRNGLLSGNSFKSLMDGGYLHIFGGTSPASPNDNINENATLLATIYSDGGDGAGSGAGLNFATGGAEDGVLAKADESWDNSEDGNIATGVATFYVFTASGEDVGTALAASTSAPRFMGTIAQAGADLNMTSTSLTAGATQEVNAFAVAMPEEC